MTLISLLSRYSNATIFASIFLTLVAGLGLLWLEISPDNRAFYGAEYEEYADLLEFEDHFEINSFVAFAVTSPGSIFESPRFRDSIYWLENHSPKLRNFVRTISIASIPQARSENDELVVRNLLGVVCPKDCDPNLLSLVMRENHIGRLISSDERTLMLYAIVDVDPEIPDEVSLTYESIKVLVKDFENEFPELSIEYTGAVPMMQAFVNTAAEDSSSVVALAFLTIFIFLAIALGSWRLAILLFLTGGFAAGIALGIAGWAGMTLNTATAVVPIVVFTLVVAGAMHLVVHYLQRLDDGPDDSIQNLEASYKAQVGPMLLASATSILSLLSLLFVTSPPIKELGVLSAIGVLAGFLLSFTFLGLCLPKIRVLGRSGGHRVVRQQLNTLARWSERGSPAAWLFLAVFLTAGSGVFLLKIDDDFIRYFDSDVPFRKTVESLMHKGVGSPYQLEVVLTSNSSGGVLAPPILKYVRIMEERLRENLSVLNVSSVVDVLDDVALALDLEQDYSDTSVTNQLYLAYELGLPPRQTSAAFLDSSRTKLRTSILLRDVTSNQTRELESWIYDFHANNAPGNVSLLVTGENIPVAHLSKENISESMRGLLPVLLFVAAALALAARKLRFFWVGLISIAVPIAAGFGLWGWLVGDMGLAAAIILAATVGVVIDDTIHIVYRFEDGLRELHLEPLEAASYAIHKSGPAVVITSLCLSLGFVLMYFSSYAVNQVFGITACLIFTLAMLFDLIVLPKLLAFKQLN